MRLGLDAIAGSALTASSKARADFTLCHRIVTNSQRICEMCMPATDNLLGSFGSGAHRALGSGMPNNPNLRCERKIPVAYREQLLDPRLTPARLLGQKSLLLTFFCCCKG